MIFKIGRDGFKRNRFHASVFSIILLVTCTLATTAMSQQVTIGFGESSLSERALQLIALITVLSLAPSILIMVTSFTRIVVVLSLLRTAIGIQQAPPNSVIISLSLFLTAFVMTPVFEQVYTNALQPMIAEDIGPEDAFARASEPIRTFMLANVREQDLDLFARLSGNEEIADLEQISLRILIPAFMISELRRAFEIGFLLFIPFIIIDMVVASVLMSMGMMMLPPVLISLPFKLVFFVLIDGWNMIAGSLIQSFGT